MVPIRKKNWKPQKNIMNNFKVGDLARFVRYDGSMVVAEFIGVVIAIQGMSIRIRWDDGESSWMHENWLERVK